MKKGPLTLVQLLQIIMDSKQDSQFLRAFRRWRNQNNVSEQVLRNLGLKSTYDAAVRGDCIQDPYRLAAVLRQLNVPLNELFQLNDRPWDGWEARKSIVLMVGGRRMETLPGVVNPVGLRSVGVADVLTISWLLEELPRRIDCRVIVEVFSYEFKSAHKEIEAYLERLPNNVGAVIAIGSPRVNAAADVLAAQILGNTKAPGRFRWGSPAPMAGAILSEPGQFAPKDEGICLKDNQLTTYPRTRPYLVKKNKPPFKDCGMVLVDSRQPLLKIICAGHGGIGSRAAAYGLTTGWRIHQKLEDEKDFLGENRAFEFVLCNKEDIKPEHGQGWHFADM